MKRNKPGFGFAANIMLAEIQEILKSKSDPKAKSYFQKFIPSSQNVYGVRVPILNELAKQYKSGGFKLVQDLWHAGAFEERLLAAKTLGRICKKDPVKTLELILQFSNEISDWAVCDTLATQSVRGIAQLKQGEIFQFSGEFLKSDNMWQRRFGIVLLINFAKDEGLREEIRTLIMPLEGDGEYYIKKAMTWIKKNLDKKSHPTPTTP